MNCSPPLQNPLIRHGVNRVLLNIIHHPSQQLKEMLPHGLAKSKPLHEIPTTSVYCLQTGNALLRDSKAMEINIVGPNTQKIHKIKVISLELVKSDEENSSLTH